MAAIINIEESFGQMARIVKNHILSTPQAPCPALDEVCNILGQIVAFSVSSGGFDQSGYLGDNPKQADKYKRIIYAGKISAALKHVLFDCPVNQLTDSDGFIAKNRFLDHMSDIFRLWPAIIANSDINPHYVPVGVDEALFDYATAMHSYNGNFGMFSHHVRILSRSQLQKLKKAMQYADFVDVLPFLGSEIEQGIREKYTTIRTTKEEDPYYQIVDAFIAKHALAALGKSRKRER